MRDIPIDDFINLLPAALWQSNRVLIALADLNGKLLHSNAHLHNTIFGHTGEELLSYLDTLDTESLGKYQQALRELKSNPSAVVACPLTHHTSTHSCVRVAWEISYLSVQPKPVLLSIGTLEQIVSVPAAPFHQYEQHYLALVAQNTSNAVIITDTERKIIWVNEGFTRITGYTRDEAMGYNPGHLLQCEESNPDTIALMRKHLNQRKSISCEIINRNKHGSRYWIELEIQTIYDSEGNHVGFMAIQSDITLRKQAQEQMQALETRLLANLNNTPNVAVQWYNQEGKVIYWNPASERLYGWTADEAIGKTLDQLIHTPEEAAQFQQILTELSTTQRAYGPYESPVKHRNGTQYWVLATTFSIPMGNGKIAFVCMDVDITELKQISQALIDSEERYRSVVSAIKEGLVVQDLEDRIIMCNQSAATILGLTMEQLMGKNSHDPHWQALKEDNTPFKPEEHPTMITIRTGKPVDDVLMNVYTKEGERKYIIVNTRPVFNHEGKMYGAVASFTDITAQKKAEQALISINQHLLEYQELLKQNIEELYTSQAKIEKQKQHLEQEINERKVAEQKIIAQNNILREIAWHQSHSLRRPVATILGLVQLLEMKEFSNEREKADYLEYLRQTALELDVVIHTIVAKADEIE